MVIMKIDFFPAVENSHLLLLVISGILGLTVSDTLLFISLKNIGAGNWAIVDCLYSPMLLLFGFLLLNETLSVFDYFGGMLVITACFLVYKAQTYERKSTAQSTLAILIAILAVFSNALSVAIVKPVLLETSLIWATTVRLFAGLLPLAGLAIISKNHRGLWVAFQPNKSWKFIVPAAVIGNYVALVFWMGGFKYTEIGAAGVLNKLSTILILIFSLIFLGEKLTLLKFIAGVLGIGGGILVFYL